MGVVLTVVSLDVVVGVVIFGVVVVFDETEVIVVGLRDVVLDDVVIVGVVCEVVLVVVSFPYKANAVNETKKSFVLLNKYGTNDVERNRYSKTMMPYHHVDCCICKGSTSFASFASFRWTLLYNACPSSNIILICFFKFHSTNKIVFLDIL